MKSNSIFNYISRIWFIGLPVLLLSLLGIYSLAPGNLLFPEKTSDQIIETKISEKKKLEAEITALSKVKDQPFCVGDQVISPSDNLLPPQSLSDSKSTVSKLDKAVVLIVVTFKNSDAYAFGSGFFISQKLIVTNGHVVSTSDDAAVKDIFVINKFLGIQKASINNIDFDTKTQTDFAVLELDENLGVPLKFAQTDGVTQFRLLEVIAAGFPGSVIQSDEKFINLMNAEKFEVPELVITDGSINSKQKVFGEINAFVHTAQISQGNSGGPLVNKCGEVLGINTFLVAQDDDVRNFSITAGELQNFLRQSGVQPVVSSGKCQ